MGTTAPAHQLNPAALDGRRGKLNVRELKAAAKRFKHCHFPKGIMPMA